jgi:hypothetical protein
MESSGEYNKLGWGTLIMKQVRKCVSEKELRSHVRCAHVNKQLLIQHLTGNQELNSLKIISKYNWSENAPGRVFAHTVNNDTLPSSGNY